MTDRTRSLRPFFVSLVLLMLAAPAVAEEFTETLTLDTRNLRLVDLIGEVSLVPADGDAFVLDVSVRGKDADRDRIKFRVEKDEGLVKIEFPLDEETRYVYPELGHGKSNFRFDDRDPDGDGLVGKLLHGRGGRKVTVSGSGRGLELWADVVVHVPAESAAKVRLGAGRIEASGTAADLELDTSVGPVVASDHHGRVYADTGSGSVRFERIDGDAVADTGSGGVVVRSCKGEEIKADTGSGSVEMTDVDCRKLVADTGSGSVTIRGAGADAAVLDTGSGGIDCEFVRMGDGKYVLDTGSGGIELKLPQDASCKVSCDVGSGGIDVDVPGVTVPRHAKEFEFTVGGGDARVVLDTGSGGIKVAKR